MPIKIFSPSNNNGILLPAAAHSVIGTGLQHKR